MSKWYQNGVDGKKVLHDNSIERCTRPDLNLTIYDETKYSSCHIQYSNNILHPVSSYYFQSHKKLCQAGNFNVNVRPDLLYFSIWEVYSKPYQKHNLLPMKTAKTLCTSSRRLVWWNVIHSTKISVVFLALKANGQKYWMPLVVPKVKNIMQKRYAGSKDISCIKSLTLQIILWFFIYYFLQKVKSCCQIHANINCCIV